MPGTRTRAGGDILQIVAAVLRDRQADGWLVGGTVRDLELGCSSPDIDLVVTGDAAAVAEQVARALGSPWFTLSHEHRAYRVVCGERHVDIAALRGADILADLGERDFTVNAMAMALGDGAVLDPFGGLAHLRERRLAAVSEHIFADDPLRLMRAARFGHCLGLSLEPDLARAVRACASQVDRAAPERVATEMVLTLAAGRSGGAARLWDGLGLLDAVFPELDGSPDAEIFTLLDHLETILADPGRRFPNASGVLSERLERPIDGSVSRPVALRLAGLLRGLPPADAAGIAQRLRLSAAAVSMVRTAARVRACCDARGVAVPGVGAGPAAAKGAEGRPGREAVLFLWEAAPWEPETILLGAAAAHDSMVIAPEASVVARQAAPAEDGGPAARSAALTGLMDLWAERALRGAPRLPFDGFALMRELRVSPGPRLGRALRAARLVWEAGEATTADEALAVARAAAGDADGG